jgi:hypothetical protein
MKPATQDDFNQQVDAAITRLEASTLALEVLGQHYVAGMWPWQKRAMLRALDGMPVYFSSQPHRFEVFVRAKQLLKDWAQA